MAKIKGNKKNNKLKGTNNEDKIVGLGGDDKLNGKGGNDKLLGGKGNDLLNGGSSYDTLRGGSGDDTMLAQDDSVEDKFIGGGGVDTVSYAESKVGAIVDLLINKGEGAAQFDIYKSIENVDGTRFDDRLTGDGVANVLRGSDGDDELRGMGGNDRLEGGNGADWLIGSDGNDRLDGGAGDDLLHGDAGADAFIGGAGFDTANYYFATSRVVVNLTNGFTNGSALGDTFSSIEKIICTSFADVMTGDGNANFFYGQGGADVIAGNGGNDVLDGGEGADIVNGGDGNDRVFAGEATAVTDYLVGGKGDDWIDYSGASKGVGVGLATGETAGHAEGDSLSDFENVQGSAHADQIQPAAGGRAYGGDGGDIVFDAPGTEVLRGGRGLDTLSDLLNEDGATDIFMLENGMGRDKVIGFDQGLDLFWLSKHQFGDLDFNASGVLANGQVVNSTAPSATIGGAQLIFETDTKILWYDQDGIGGRTPIEIAVIAAGPASLTKSDFLVVPDI